MRCVPLVDGGVELQTGVSTFPCCGCELTPEIAGLDGAHGAAIGDRLEVPVAVLFNSLHELVSDAH
ncbi:unannotated protein [freshwater metagenome]|uniref:Unannotated protein n=1 Tax=freshwater metagenome TaxID=449393 RepID=A0A6J6NSG5_9ZZZZ